MLINEDILDNIDTSELTDRDRYDDIQPLNIEDYTDFKHMTETYIKSDYSFKGLSIREICEKILYPLQRRIYFMFYVLPFINEHSHPVFVIYDKSQTPGEILDIKYDKEDILYCYSDQPYHNNDKCSIGFYMQFNGKFDRPLYCKRLLQGLTNLTIPMMKGENINCTVYGRYVHGSAPKNLSRSTYDQYTQIWQDKGYDYQLENINNMYDWCINLMGAENCNYADVRKLYDNPQKYEYAKIFHDELCALKNQKLIDIKKVPMTNAGFVDLLDDTPDNQVGVEFLKPAYYRMDLFNETHDRERAKQVIGNSLSKVYMKAAVGDLSGEIQANIAYIFDMPFREGEDEGLIVLSDIVKIKEIVDLLYSNDEPKMEEGMQRIINFVRPLYKVEANVESFIKQLVEKSSKIKISASLLSKIIQRFDNE